ncbi:hypothetical protein LNT81_07540 [Campylobacter sp. VicNov18]|nr:hypothetical protein [Campylobacter bilis]MCC8278520.1 hypothetical protein [Campylobacter bilis]
MPVEEVEVLTMEPKLAPFLISMSPSIDPSPVLSMPEPPLELSTEPVPVTTMAERRVRVLGLPLLVLLSPSSSSSSSKLVPMFPSLTIPAVPPKTSPAMVIWAVTSLPLPMAIPALPAFIEVPCLTSMLPEVMVRLVPSRLMSF